MAMGEVPEDEKQQKDDGAESAEDDGGAWTGIAEGAC
jgi:hypothetical protein